MTTIPAPDGLAARAEYAMERVPSADVRRRSRPPAEPPAMGVIGGRESLSTHMAVVLPDSKVSDTLISPRPGGNSPERARAGRWSDVVVAVAVLVVRAEEVGAEVAGRIVPHGVDVVGVVLGVVELDQHGRPVDPIVVAVTRLDRPRPGEVQALDAGFRDPPQLGVGQIGAHVPRVLLDQAQELLSLRRREVGGGNAGR